MNFVVIGETTAKLSNSVKNDYPQIPWNKIKGFRNIIAHDYFGVDAEIVWETANTLIPTVLPDVMRVVLTEQQAARQDNKQSS